MHRVLPGTALRLLGAAGSPPRQVVLHARWVHGNPDHDGNITYQPGHILGMTGPRMDCVKAELLAVGAISFTADAQLGKAGPPSLPAPSSGGPLPLSISNRPPAGS